MEYPKFNLRAIASRRDAIKNTILRRGPVTVRGGEVERLIADIRGCLPRSVRYDVVFESIRNLVGVQLDYGHAAQTAWRLAGNVHRLVQGRPAPLWAAQQEPEWVPLHAISGVLGRNARGRLGYTYRLKILAGTPCPMVVTVFWSRQFLSFLARQVGFSAPWQKYPYVHGTELVHLYFMGHIDPLRSRFEPGFSEYGAPQSMIKRNRERVLRLRKRFNEQCPYGWTHECHRCYKGYELRDNYDGCPAGTHRLNYVRKLCLGCERDSYFDYDQSREKCITCLRKERLKYEH